MPQPGTRTLDHQYFIQAPPERTFEAVTNPRMLVKWLADTAEIDLRKGGSYKLGWNGGPTHTGTIVELVPGRSIALSWEWPGVELRGTVFKLSVEPKDAGSLLRVEHSGFPTTEMWTDLYGGAEWGWTYFALNLKSILENGHDLRSPHDG